MSLCQSNGSHVPALERRAQGVVDPHNPGKRRIVVTVDEAMFRDVGRAADLAGVSVTEALRQLIRRGLDAPDRAPAPDAIDRPLPRLLMRAGVVAVTLAVVVVIEWLRGAP